MTLILVPKRHDSRFSVYTKPAIRLELDRNNPFCSELRHAFIFQPEDKGAQALNPKAHYDHGTERGYAGQGQHYIIHGKQAILFSGSGTGIPISDSVNPGNPSFPDAVSVTARAYYNNLGQDHTLLDFNDQALTFWADTASSQLRSTAYPASSPQYGTIGELDSPPWVTWGGSALKNGSSSNVRTYVDGITSASADSVGSTGWSTTLRYRFGVNYGGSTKASNAYYEYIFCWQRELSSAEFREIQKAPYQIFKPAIPITYFIPAASGAYTLTADAGSYALTGSTTGLKADRNITAGAGSYSLTGQTTGLKKGSKLSANSGTYTTTGQTVGLIVGYKLIPDSGSYTLTGQDVTLTYSPASSTYTLTCDSGSYLLSGVDQGFLRTYALSAESGSFILSGQNVTLSYSSGVWTVQSDETTTWTLQPNNSDTWTVQ